MLNRAILELEGVFNVKKTQKQASIATARNGKTNEPLQDEVKDRQFVYPRIYPKDMAAAMDNYRKYQDHYNEKVKAENLGITKYNNVVKRYRKKNQLPKAKLMALSSFYKMISIYDTWEQNKRVEAFNRTYGMIAEKTRIQSIKYSTELIFQSIIWHYSMQLQKREEERRKLDVAVAAPLPEVKLHSGWLTKKKVKEIVRLPICQRTFRRHRERLSEAGILTGYKFEGSARPVKMSINQEILTNITENQEKSTGTENQSAKGGERTVLPHNNVSFSHSCALNKPKIKANVNKHSIERNSGDALMSLYSSSKRNTYSQDAEKNDAGREKTPGARKKITISQFLRSKIENENEFCANLAGHAYDNYTPLRIEILEKEAHSGSLDREEFKTLVIQEFFKIFSKNYREATPFAGSWRKAYNTWMRDKFITYNNLTLHKHNIVQRVPQLRWRSAYVGRFIKNHKEFKLLFPGEYFDTTRTTAKEGGFEYTIKAWEKHLQDQSRYQSKKKIQKAEAQRRKRKLTNYQKVVKHVKSYLKDRINLEELHTKVEQIGDKQLIQALPEILQSQLKKFL